jgi:TonB family protein
MPEVAGMTPVEKTHENPPLHLLVELPSRSQVFFGNFSDLFRSHKTAPLDLLSAPALFWPDVFVTRGLPWRRFFESVVYHALACGLLWAVSGFLMLEPQAIPRPAVAHDEVIYYTPEEYLPPLDTRRPDSAQPQKADPEYSAQSIISVPPEADNHSQTIVTPPDVKLKPEVALPNVVAWSEQPKMPIAPAPAMPATNLARIAPSAETRVVAPAPDLTRADEGRDGPGLQTSVIAPPPDVNATPQENVRALGAAVIAPPPEVAANSMRPMGDVSIARSAIIAPAPRLALDAQRAVAGRNPGGSSLSPQVIAPPPALRASSGTSAAGGRLIALNLHPSVGAPPDPPVGNRRGSFASTPEGHRGASGAPGSSAGNGTDRGVRGTSGRNNSGLPSGLYVGKATNAAETSPIAGDPAPSSGNLVNPNLIASLRPPRITASPSRGPHPAAETKLSPEEREVFQDRKFYSLTLNMPNLNSAGGSWIIRFAERKPDSSSNSSSDPPAADVSAPSAVRKVDPAYPLELMRQNVGGTVILFAVIHADGSVGEVRVLRSVDDRLDQYASSALSQWKFAPATKNGAPVEVEATFQIPFHPVVPRSNF